MKIAVLGGTFNPIHNGHMALADSVCKELGYDKIIFVPSFIPPHKELSSSVSGKERIKMVGFACRKDKRFILETCEFKRGGVSYTYDTICYLEKKYAGVLEGKMGLIMGEDLFSGFHLWHKAKELSEKCTLILAKRPGVDVSYLENSEKFMNPSLGEYARLSNDFELSSEPLFKNAVVLKTPMLPISSTEIRALAAENGAFCYLVPEKIFKYITKGKLYAKNK